MDIDAGLGMNPTPGASGGLAGAQAAESEIAGLQQQTIDAKLRSKRQEAAFAQANAFLSQSVS